MPYYRDTWVEVNLDYIFENVQGVRRHLPDHVKVIAVVKANAYGHGDIQVARTAIEAGAEALAVAILDEALALRKAGITVPILVLGWVRPQDTVIAARHDITLTVFQSDWLQEVADALPEGERLRFHIKMDSGMGRLGVKTETETKQIISQIASSSEFELEGAYTHFATADELDTAYYERQYELFIEMLGWIRDLGVEPEIVHSGNSAATLRFPDQAFNAVRFGISMYGLSPSEEIKPLLPYKLKPAFSLHSKLIHVKEIEPGESVSYGATYTASQKEWIGTVPVGYADGWIRKLSALHVIAGGEVVPVAGRICMDQLMVRLPYKMERETKVTLIGEQGGHTVTADDAAACLETINYEIPCMISERVPRVYIRNQKVTEVNNYVVND
ncbi:alanine racemase [Bacillus marinisedimentorum]|uniref:alanine racemase n=1 Tax=Bacillus marinisedimentorum TaxID=1821260 RepID=UPI000873195C